MERVYLEYEMFQDQVTDSSRYFHSNVFPLLPFELIAAPVSFFALWTILSNIILLFCAKRRLLYRKGNPQVGNDIVYF